jgi:hypothetical protein
LSFSKLVSSFTSLINSIKFDQVQSSSIKFDRIRSRSFKFDQVRSILSSSIKFDQFYQVQLLRSNSIKFDQIRSIRSSSIDSCVTVFVREDCRADVARPHPERGGQLAGHLRMAGQVLAQAPLVHVELAAHGARVVGRSTLGWLEKQSRVLWKLSFKM